MDNQISFGDAKISEKHSNFFININNASFKDMHDLINFVKKKVKRKNWYFSTARIRNCKLNEKKILVLGGGYSKERSISLKSAKAVIKSINNKYKVKFADPCNNFLKTVENYKPDVIFNALHGRFGEDGYIQSILETLAIKYTHSGVKSSMSAMDKEISKNIFIKHKILTPKYIKIKNNIENLNYKKIKKYLGYPVVIKP